MKLLHRMLVAPMLAVGFLLASAVVAHVALRSVTDKFETLRDERMRAAHDLAGLTLRMAELNAQLYRTLVLSDSLGPEKMAAARKAMEDETRALGEAFEGFPTRVPPEAAEPVRSVPPLMAKYRSLAIQALTMAESTPGGGAMMLGGAEKAFKAAFAAVAEINRLVDADVDATSAQVVQVSKLASRSIVALCVLAIAVSLAFAIVSARRIVARVERAVQVSESIARGELNPVPVDGSRDEVGRLLQSLANTSVRLSESVREIQQASGSISVAATEIANGSMDLSQRTELTAGSLEHTRAAMKEMGGLVVDGSRAAREARTLASGASELADSGGNVVAEVVQTMREINDESKRIADITGVIDGIAFQTNILALNAAVEAARAGEQGRGFAVVAGEVRALAQRSASAAKEIKQLIGGSVQKIEQGTGLADRAGQTMQQIVGAVRRVDEMIEAVGRSSGQQDQSVTEVTGTLERFDSMTQENAALSEQSAAASESLRQQAARLAEITGRFKVAA